MKLKDITVNGKTFEIHVGENGYFEALVDGERQAMKSTLNELELSLMKITKRESIRISVPFINSRTGKRGEITGRHGGNASWLYSDGDKRGIQTSSLRTGRLNGENGWFDALRTDTDIEKLKELTQAAAAATEALKQFIHQHGFDLSEQARKAWIAAGGADKEER